VFAGLLVVGCASTKATHVDVYHGPRIPKPARIIIYDFAATPADIPDWSEARQAYAEAGADMDADELEQGRKLGATVAKELVEQINGMRIVAVRAEGQPEAQLNDIAITGYFVSIDKGSAVERVVVGFGTGTAEVKTHVDGYRMTEAGMQRLGGGDIDSGGAGKSPGMLVPALVTVATHNPVGLVVGGAVKAEGEVSGRTTDEGSAKRIADEISKHLRALFERQGWI
jgi:hypothetical protein